MDPTQNTSCTTCGCLGGTICCGRGWMENAVLRTVNASSNGRVLFLPVFRISLVRTVRMPRGDARLSIALRRSRVFPRRIFWVLRRNHPANCAALPVAASNIFTSAKPLTPTGISCVRAFTAISRPPPKPTSRPALPHGHVTACSPSPLMPTTHSGQRPKNPCPSSAAISSWRYPYPAFCFQGKKKQDKSFCSMQVRDTIPKIRVTITLPNTASSPTRPIFRSTCCPRVGRTRPMQSSRLRTTTNILPTAM